MKIENGKASFDDLVKGYLIKRYKRFLADIKLESGEVVTAHCANSGSMKNCILEGAKVYISPQNRPERKLKYTWEMIRMPTSLVGVNTGVPNKLVASAVKSGKIAELTGFKDIRSEVKTSENTRLDLLLKDKNGKECYVEIKNCTLVEKKHAFFPDAITTRGQKHIRELMTLADQGYDTALFFLIQRMDADIFSPADHIDPEYGRLLREASKKGVKILVYDTFITESSIEINKSIKILL